MILYLLVVVIFSKVFFVLFYTSIFPFGACVMKILISTDSMGAGGAERQFIMLYTALLNMNHDVKFASLGTGYYYNYMLDAGLLIYSYPRKHSYDLSPLFRISSLINSFRPDIVHTWGWMSTFSSALVCKRHSIPLVSSVRSGTPPKKIIRSFLEISISDLVISNSIAGLVAHRVPTEKGHVVYNGFDCSRIPSSSKSYDCFAVVMVARMARGKDWQTFIDAARSVINRTGDKIIFIGIGDGPDRENILNYGKDLIENGLLLMPGFSQEPLDWLLNANVGVLSSSSQIHYEGTSNSILEYMACELPVVCTKSGGNLETVIDGTTGILVKPGDSKELSSAILKLFNQPDYAHRLGKAGRKRLEEVYSISNMTNNTLNVYEKALAQVPLK